MTPFRRSSDEGEGGLPWPDSAESWRTLLDRLPVGVILLDEEGRVAGYNRAESELAGTRPAEVVGRDFFGEVAPCAEVRELAGVAREALADPDAELDRELDFRFEFDDGGLDVRIRMRKLRLDGEPCIVLVIEDNTRLKEAERSLEEALERARELARRDPLTGLANRRWFEERLTDELRRADRYDHPVSLMVVDVDHFKRVNDRWGHHVGDEVLTSLADAFRDSLRDSDQAFRVGGEEFCLLLPHADAGQAEKVAERLHRRVAGVEVDGAPGLDLSVSVGVAAAGSGAEEPVEGGRGEAAREADVGERLWRRADEALYRAKETGRARTVTAGGGDG